MLRRWPTAWRAGSRAAWLSVCLLILPAERAWAVSENEIARAVERFVAGLGSGSVASLGDIDGDEARDLVVASVCVNVHSFRARMETVDGSGATVALDLVASRILRNTAQTTESLPDRWVLTIACDAGGCRVQRAMSKAEAIAIALLDAPENERERILAEEAGEETAVSLWLARHAGGRSSIELLRLARQIASRSGDLAAEAYTAMILAMVHHRQHGGLEESAEALELARTSGNADGIVEALHWLGYARWAAGDAGGLEDLRAAAAMTGELRDPRLGLAALEHLCVAQVNAGELRTALQTANEIRELSGRYGWTEGESIGARRAALVYYALQD